MKTLIFFGGFLLALAIAGEDPYMSIKEFEEKFGEEFATKEDEDAAAEELAKNEAEVDLENTMYDEGEGTFKEEINEWSDMDPVEFAIEKTGLNPVEPDQRYYETKGWINDPNAANTEEEIADLDRIYSEVDRQSLPASWDSRAKGYVTSVKNQGGCGSCLAFGTNAALEVSLIKAGAKKDGLDISEQYLVDCGFGKNGANGCNGAQPGSYAKFYNENGNKQVIHEAKYPYTASVTSCKAGNYWNPGAKIVKAHVDYQCSDDKIMKMVYKHGAVMTGVDASGGGWGQFKSGVYSTCGTNVQANHAVTIVGWGTEQGIPYYLIKNSWGPNWGASGFIKVKRGTCDMGAVCIFYETSANGSPDKAPENPSGGDCKDKKEECSGWKDYCQGQYKAWMEKNCPKTCGACPKSPAGPTQSSCDVSKTFGKLNGKHILTFTANGKEHRPEVVCVDGMCKPQNPNIPEACLYICGKGTCDHIKKKESGGGDCQDLDPSKIGCAKFAEWGYCEHQYMVANCKKSCNLCNTGSCKDLKDNCGKWAAAGFCNAKGNVTKNFMIKNCQKTCKLC